MVHIVHIPPVDWKGLWTILRSKPAHCEPSRWNAFRTWADEHRPRLPAWGIDIYGWDHETQDPDSEYEYLFSLYQLNWLEVRQVEKLMRATDRPHVLNKHYWWD